VLDGGFERWVREGHPVETGVRVPSPAAFQAKSVGNVVHADDVLAHLAHPHYALVDARVPERFKGEVEPLDPVAGHIPGARNRPYGSNLASDGTFKPAAVLAREFRELLGDTPLDEVVHYCGSGVTACHNVLAMEVAGLPGTRIYPGSWSEWVADAARPVADGNEGGTQ
jgi:thiosulfate/3-mercaptopyruvate sulfurtransferase